MPRESRKKIDEFSSMIAVEEESPIIQNSSEPKPPRIFTAEWDAYVMSHFNKDELENDSPRVAGLRRVTQYLIGPICKTSTHVYQCPTPENERRAVVGYGMTIMVHLGGHPLYSQEMELEDVADVYVGNTNEPYHLHPIASAATKAEARILRKVLGIKAIAAEEGFNKLQSYEPQIVREGYMSDAQYNVMNLLFQRLNVSPVAFLKKYKNGLTGNQLTEEDAIDVMRTLNNLQKEKIPEELSNYKEGWR